MTYLLCFVVLAGIVSRSVGNFSYSRRDQHLWQQRYKACGGKFQSPIAITTSTSISVPLPAIEMVGYHDLLPRPVSIKNTGHTVAVNVLNKSDEDRTPRIFGSVFDKKHSYEMDHLHFHWGGRNDRGSEHVLNYIKFPMEMHIVHRNRAYKTFDEALNHKDGLAVIAVFFQLRDEDNESLGPIVKHLPAIKWRGTEVLTNVSFNLAALLPRNIDAYYVYKGSLTTPPCNEVVTWLIFSTPVPISYRQIGKFRTLSNGESALQDNYRQIQHRHGRKVYRRRSGFNFVGGYDIPFLGTGTLKWHGI